jgi:hypothetical protein
MLDSLGQLPEASRKDISLDVVLPLSQMVEAAGPGPASAQDSLFKSLAMDRLTARLDMGKLATRDQGSIYLCRFFESLSRNTKLVELKLCGVALTHTETMALAAGLLENRSIKRIDLTNCRLDLGGRDFFDEAVLNRPDLKVIY